MVYWRKKKTKYSEVYALVKSKFKDTKAKDDTNTGSTFSPEKMDLQRFSFFSSHLKLETLPVIGLHTQWGDLFDFSGLVNRDSLF